MASKQIQQATKDQVDTAMASEQIQQATKNQVDTAMASEQIQQATKDQRNAAMTSSQLLFRQLRPPMRTTRRKQCKIALSFFAKLTSVKEPAKVMELQSEYAKNAYETLVVESKDRAP